MLGIDETVKRYIQCRDIIKAAEEQHKETLKPLKELLNRLSGQLECFLDESGKGVDSVRTDQGTFYRSIKYTASLADPGMFMTFVEMTHKFELLDRRANATAVRDYTKKNGALPPGCNLSAITTIGVWKPGAKKDDDSIVRDIVNSEKEKDENE